MVALVELPVEAVSAVHHGRALGRLIVLEQHVLNYRHDLVGGGGAAPTQISHRVVDAGQSRVTARLHRVPADGADGGEGIARAHEDGIGRVPKVPSSCADDLLVAETDLIAWRSGETESSSGHGFTWCFEGDDGETICQPDETGCRASEGVSCQPHLGVWVDF